MSLHHMVPVLIMDNGEGVPIMLIATWEEQLKEDPYG